jgi:hypothetical protein
LPWGGGRGRCLGGRGMWWGRSRWWNPSSPSAPEETEALRAELAAAEADVAAIKSRLEELVRTRRDG